MNKHTKIISRDMEQLTEDARALLAATGYVTGENVENARKRLKAALDNGNSMLNRVDDEIFCETREALECLRVHPRVSIAAALAFGFPRRSV